MDPIASSKSDCATYYQRSLQDIRGYLADDDDKAALAVNSEEVSLFESALPDLIAFAQSQVPSTYLHPPLVDSLYSKLDDSIPANELDGVPAGMADIILAGWVYYHKIDQTSSGDEFILNYQVLMRLLLKSLFSSHVHSEYLKTKRLQA